MLNPLIENAYKVLDGGMLTRDEAVALATEVTGADILDLLSLANKVRLKYAGEFFTCSILNAKSGVCSQNCRFCAQSAHHNTGVDEYPLVSVEDTVAAARTVYESGGRTFGVVTSGYGYTDTEDAEFQQLLAMLDAIYAEFPDMRLCVSIGILSKETATELAKHHTGRYNMNLQTAPERYEELIADTHSVEDKFRTMEYLREHGVELCCGGIIGLGESMADRIDMAIAVRRFKPEGIPLNVLLPIPGTPLEKVERISAREVAVTFALVRLLNPAAMIKFAAGRETAMKDFQGLLMLAGANGIMTGGYLTTRGRSVAEDEQFLEELINFSA